MLNFSLPRVTANLGPGRRLSGRRILAHVCVLLYDFRVLSTVRLSGVVYRVQLPPVVNVYASMQFVYRA